jgi:hypothetical protein
MKRTRFRLSVRTMMLMVVLSGIMIFYLRACILHADKMWIVVPLFATLTWLAPGPVAAVWGFVVLVRRKMHLTRRQVITGKPAIALGILAIVVGLAYGPLLIYWAMVNYPTGW